jgi:hypothetical protein
MGSAARFNDAAGGNSQRIVFGSRRSRCCFGVDALEGVGNILNNVCSHRDQLSPANIYPHHVIPLGTARAYPTFRVARQKILIPNFLNELLRFHLECVNWSQDTAAGS